MLTEEEEEFVDFILEAGHQVLDQDTFEFMIEDGVPADSFINSYKDYTLGEVLESLEEKGLAYIESKEETIHYNGSSIRGDEVQPIKWEDTGFKTIDRQYIHFTEKLEDLYEE